MKRIVNPEKLTLNLTEAASMMDLSVRLMTQLANTEGFPAFHVGKRWVIPKQALQDWLNNPANMGRVYGNPDID